MKKKFEIFLIRFASRILRSRNIERASFITRKDNNQIWYISDRLDSISKRMECSYDENN